MKKKMIVLLAAALMTLSASSAFAAFGNLDLIRVVYDRAGTVEILTDLGTVASLQSTHDLTIGGGTAAFTNFTPTTGTPDLYVAYYAKNSAATDFWFAVDASQTSARSAGLKWNTLNTGTTTVGAYYSGKTAVTNAGGQVTAVGTTTDDGAYVRTLNASGSAPGTFLNFTHGDSVPYTEVSLAGLATAAVNQNLYWFNSANAGQTITSAYLTLRTNADGSTTINASQVPIPAAAYLLGSGLLGLVGFRRKSKG